jgi:hypothetical protein
MLIQGNIRLGGKEWLTRIANQLRARLFCMHSKLFVIWPTGNSTAGLVDNCTSTSIPFPLNVDFSG